MCLAPFIGGGYAAGSWLNSNYIQGTPSGDLIGELVTRIMAAAGSDNAQQSLNRAEQFNGELKISFDGQGRPQVQSLRTSGQVDIDVDTGPLAAGVGG